MLTDQEQQRPCLSIDLRAGTCSQPSGRVLGYIVVEPCTPFVFTVRKQDWRYQVRITFDVDWEISSDDISHGQLIPFLLLYRDARKLEASAGVHILRTVWNACLWPPRYHIGSALNLFRLLGRWLSVAGFRMILSP